MSKHTPGPWVKYGNAARGLFVRSTDRLDAIAKVYTINRATNMVDDELLANAALIEAAPELLAELRTAIAVLDELGYPHAMPWARELVARLESIV